MRFRQGQVFEAVNGDQTAVVVRARGGGRAGLIRFPDTGFEEWLLWSALDRDGNWRLKDEAQ
jgi:hypothetical protein